MTIHVKGLGGRSGQIGTDKEEHVLLFDAWDDANRWPDFEDIFSNVIAFAPTSFLGLSPTNIDYDEAEDGNGHYVFTITYASDEPAESTLRVSFDTTGGTIRARASRATATYAASGRTAPDFKGAIEVSGGEAQGVDIVLPALKLTFAYKWPKAVITIADAKSIASLTGKTNSTKWFGFDPGELLFLGASGDIDLTTPTEIAYNFAASANATLSIGSWITGIVKKGHQHLWVAFEDVDDTSADKLVQRPLAAYVETMYVEDDFSKLGIGS